MGKNANIKRAGQDSSNTATPSKPSAPSTAAVSSATATTTAAAANQWSSGSGGDVLGWLTQKTQAEAPKSRGAVEYFAKKSANNNNSKSGKTATNKGNNNNTANTTPSTANTNNNNKVAKAVHDDPNKVKTKSNTTNNASKTTAAQPPATEKKAAAPTTTSVDAWSNKDAVKQLAAMFPGKTKKEADAQLPSEAATTKKTNTPPPAPRTAATTDAKDVQRGVRGRRRKDDRATRELHRQEKEQEKAMKRHEEAMETDPEYKKQFLTYQEMQQAMQQAQSEFFQKYSKQENLLVNHVVAERLDIPVILDLIDQHDVVFICTDTGSGKSTNIPKALLELSPDTRIVSTQPRRTATVSIANRVASLRRENVGEDVGYWIRGEKRGDAQTRLWYMTSYTLLLRILENPAEFPFTHIVLDEFHERQPDVEVIVALLRLALQNKLANFKLILMSATLNTKDWEEYFTGLRVASYKQSEPEHPIHDYFLEDVCALLGTDYQTPTHALRTSVVSKDVMDKHMYLAQNLVIFLNGISSPHHSILLFLPGRAQVEMMQATLTAQLGGRVDVIPWHSAVDLGEIELAMKRITPNRQKIYVATDIAEVSITLPDVVYVVDLVLVKRPHISKDVAASLLYPPLVTQWISKGSVAQRRGRIGRVQQGFYFCILPSAAVMELPEYGEPPIENARIDELSLHCLQVVPNPAAVFSLCHGQPLVETIISSMHTLTQLGCIIDVKEPHAALERMTSAELPYSADWSSLIVENAKAEVMGAEIDEYQCTFVGRILQLIPVSPQQGMLVCFGLLTGLESLMILAAAVTSSLSPFTLVQSDNGRRRYNVARAMEETENVMRDLCCGLRSDIVAVMKATLLFCVELEKNGEKNLQTVKQWCVQKHLSFEKLQLIMDLDRHIKHELAEFMPFRTIEEPTKLLEQLDKLAAMVTVMTNVAFVAQSLEVAQEESSGFNAGQESALGLFSDMTAVPDIHSPSCLRWQEGDVIIPVQLSLFFNKLLASFSTAIETPKQFWISLLLFSHRLNYATFSDDDGTFHVFALSYGGKERFVEVDDIAGYAVLTFRQKLCSICQTLRLLHSMKELPEDELSAALARHHLKPLQEAQREVIADLVSIFKRLDDMTADEVEHDEDDLDQLTILSFALPTE